MENAIDRQNNLERRLMEEYKTMYLDIQDGLNLVQHKETLLERINECSKRIDLDERMGIDATGFKSMKNEYYALVYEIGERT